MTETIPSFIIEFHKMRAVNCFTALFKCTRRRMLLNRTNTWKPLRAECTLHTDGRLHGLF